MKNKDKIVKCFWSFVIAPASVKLLDIAVPLDSTNSVAILEITSCDAIWTLVTRDSPFRSSVARTLGFRRLFVRWFTMWWRIAGVTARAWTSWRRRRWRWWRRLSTAAATAFPLLLFGLQSVNKMLRHKLTTWSVDTINWPRDVSTQSTSLPHVLAHYKSEAHRASMFTDVTTTKLRQLQN